MMYRCFITVSFYFFSFPAFCHQSLSQGRGNDEGVFKSNTTKTKPCLHRFEIGTNFQNQKSARLINSQKNFDQNKMYLYA